MIIVLCDYCHKQPPGKYETFRRADLPNWGDINICESCQALPFGKPALVAVTVVVAQGPDERSLRVIAPK